MNLRRSAYGLIARAIDDDVRELNRVEVELFRESEEEREPRLRSRRFEREEPSRFLDDCGREHVDAREIGGVLDEFLLDGAIPPPRARAQRRRDTRELLPDVHAERAAFTGGVGAEVPPRVLEPAALAAAELRRADRRQAERWGSSRVRTAVRC
jgi:hypothetical protein